MAANEKVSTSEPSTMSIRRILSIDGGGIKGVFPVAFLTHLEEAVGAPIGRYFDLIVGTSTGGILALGLALGFNACDLLAFYENNGPAIFRARWPVKIIRPWFFGKYSAEPLKGALRNAFGDRRIGDALTRLVVPSLNLDTGEVHIFKTAHHVSLETDYRCSVVDVALATAAAPSYFPAFRLNGTTSLIDGGVWVNNPTGLAAVESVGLLRWEPAATRILSLGCTGTPFEAGLARRFTLGRLYWMTKFASVSFAGQNSASLGTAKLLLGHRNVFRHSATLSRKIELDGVKSLGTLRSVAYSEARKALPTLKPVFFGSPAEAFNPVYRLTSIG